MPAVRFFDEERWREVVRRPNWCLELGPELQELKQRGEAGGDEGAAIKNEVRGFFEEQLERGEIVLAAEGEDLDVERQPIDTVVIHHAGSQSPYSLSRLNATHLLNLYVPTCFKKGQGQIWSNHFDVQGRQVFYGYHWLVNMDGSVTRLLRDDQIGWQAGDWGINTRSVGICLNADLSGALPERELLRRAAKLIRTRYSGVPEARIIGHREVNLVTVCPGGRFLPEWKQKLLEELRGA